MDYRIMTIPHGEQRYDTVGDYWDEEDHETQFRISQMQNDDHEFLVAVHELIEYYLVKKRGIKIEDIDAFDIKFEKERAEGMHGPDDEPGFAPDAPYLREHTFATKFERMVADELGVNWEEYDNEVMSL